MAAPRIRKRGLSFMALMVRFVECDVIEGSGKATQVALLLVLQFCLSRAIGPA